MRLPASLCAIGVVTVLSTAPVATWASEAVIDRTAIVKALAPVRFLPAHSQRGTRIDLDVRFELGSSRLTAEATRQLDELASALRDAELADARFVLAGHTDATGAAAMNLQLSRDRASAVRRYLIEDHAIPADRVDAKGFGETRLKKPLDPTSGANRRVEVIALPRPAVAQSRRRAITE